FLSAWPAAKVSSTETSNIEKLLHVFEASRKSVIRQAVKKYLSVTLFRDPIVQQSQNTPVRTAADQPPESLLQGDGCLRDLVIVEGFSAGFANTAHPGIYYRIARNSKRQLINNNAAQLLARNVHALPKRSGGKQHAVRCRAKFFEQRATGRGALQERGKLDFERHTVVDHAHLLVTGKKHEGAAAAVIEDPHDLFGRKPGE